MIAVFYSKATGRVRRWLSDANKRTEKDWALAIAPIMENQGLGVAYYSDSVSLPQIQARISTLTGLQPADDRYVIIDNGQIVSWIGNACEACGDFALTKTARPNAEFVKHTEADERWSYDAQAKSLIRPALSVDEQTVQANKRARGVNGL